MLSIKHGILTSNGYQYVLPIDKTIDLLGDRLLYIKRVVTNSYNLLTIATNVKFYQFEY